MDFNPDKLETTFIDPMTPYGPIKDRKYTLIHSDTTGMMFLDISNQYNYKVVNPKLRDEILGSWKLCDNNSYSLILYAYVGNGNLLNALFKYNAFKYHLNLAIQAIIYGDRDLFKTYPNLTKTPIYVKFDSPIPIFDGYEFYGYVKDYIV